MTPEALEEWRAHPVSEAILKALRASLADQRKSAEAAWWAGRPWPEADRLALLRTEALVEDMFEASAEDFEHVMSLKKLSSRDQSNHDIPD